MPETPVTREQLLASVHQLQDGDLLVIRGPKTMTHDEVHQIAEVIAKKKPEGVQTLVMSDDLAIEVVRPDHGDGLITRATRDPGRIVKADA